MKYLEILRAQLAALTEKRKALLEELEAVATLALGETRSLSDVETARAEEIRSAVGAPDTEGSLEHEIAAVEARVAEFVAIEERARNADRPELQIIKPVQVDPDQDVRYLRPTEARDQALKSLEDKVATEHLRTDQLDKVEALVRKDDKNTAGDQIARRLLATESPAYRSAWMKMVTQAQPVLNIDEARAMERFLEFRAMSSASASGGYGVPVLIDPTIVLTGQGSLNPFRAISRVETVTTDAWKGVSSAGVSWSFDAEASAVSDDSPTLAQPVVNVWEARGFIPFSIRIGADYPGFAAEMARLLGEGYDEMLALKFSTGAGDGSVEPFGIITALDANTNVEVVVTTDGAFGGVDINKVWGALPDRWKANATWVMNHDVGNEVDSFGASNNLSFFTVPLGGVGKVLKERPVTFASYFPDFTGTTGASNILVVGDFRNYLIAERAGMDVELVPHLFDVTNNRPTGQRGWFAHARVGADSINDLGFRLLQNQ